MSEDAFTQICRELCRPDPRRMTRYKDERAVRCRQFTAQLEQWQQMLGDLPRLSLRSMAVRWRIENDRIILLPAFGLALAELHRVLNNPADRSVRQSGDRRIVSCPLDNTSRRVDMHHFSTGRGRRE